MSEDSTRRPAKGISARNKGLASAGGGCFPKGVDVFSNAALSNSCPIRILRLLPAEPPVAAFVKIKGEVVRVAEDGDREVRSLDRTQFAARLRTQLAHVFEGFPTSPAVAG